MPNYWILKTEPETFSWNDHLKEKTSMWDGVRNYQARNFMKEMTLGDRVLFYHTGKEKAIVGVSEVTKEFYPDPTAENDKWVAVDISPIKVLKNPVTLDKLKSSSLFKDHLLVRNGRLSVIPVNSKEYDFIVENGGN